MGDYIHDKRLKSYNFHEEVPVSSNKQNKKNWTIGHTPYLKKQCLQINKIDNSYQYCQRIVVQLKIFNSLQL